MKRQQPPRRLRTTKKERVRMHLRIVERLIRGHVMPRGTYQLFDDIMDIDFREDETND